MTNGNKLDKGKKSDNSVGQNHYSSEEESATPNKEVAHSKSSSQVPVVSKKIAPVMMRTRNIKVSWRWYSVLGSETQEHIRIQIKESA